MQASGQQVVCDPLAGQHSGELTPWLSKEVWQSHRDSGRRADPSDPCKPRASITTNAVSWRLIPSAYDTGLVLGNTAPNLLPLQTGLASYNRLLEGRYALLRLALRSRRANDAAILTGPYFRISGGVIWDGLEHGLIAFYVGGAWKHRTRFYMDLQFEGKCRLMAGITRDLWPQSGPLRRVEIIRSLLFIDGTAFAEYHEGQDMWSGIQSHTWWPSLRIVSADLMGIAASEAAPEKSWASAIGYRPSPVAEPDSHPS